MQQQIAWKRVRGLTGMSLCDWPGKVCAVLFVGGCNLRCPTCHNGGLAWHPEQFPGLDREKTLRYLAGRKPWLDGVTVTGGEPTTAPGLAWLLRDLKGLGLPVKLDTNGQRPEVVAEILEARLADVFAVDVKGPFSKYPELTGGCAEPDSARAALSNIFALAALSPENFYFRTTRVPALTDYDMELVRAFLPPGFTLTEQKYVPPGRTHAQADSEEGRMPGNVVAGPHRAGDSQSAQSRGEQGPAAVQAAGA
jgi:pyruvate formate lyase activating enzyme